MPTALENVSLRDQLHLDRMPLRLITLGSGLTGFGVSLALLIRAGLGVDPWEVLQVAIADRTGLSIGTVIIALSFLVLLAWIPLRQHPGIGTLANALWVGVATDLTLHVLPPAGGLATGIAMMIGGVLLNGVSSAAYIGAHLGPGPRDGLMTGLHHRTGRPVARLRLVIEVGVLLVGWLLGGPVGVGTFVYAIGIGPVVGLILPWVTIPVRRRPGPVGAEAAG